MSDRVFGVWCPDWPAVAAAAEMDLSPDRPVAVLRSGRVIACSAAARAVGVRREMRKRDAQARCPQLTVTDADEGRDARLFEPVAAAVAELIPVVEVLRPGLLVLPARGVARYFGGEEAAAEKLTDVVSACGIESQVGIADELFTAIIAARHGKVVPPGEGAEFLAPLRISQLAVEPSMCTDDRPALVDLLWRMGLRTIGAFAELSSTDVATRFGADAIFAHRTARALPQRPPSGQAPPPDLVVEHRCDPPVDRVDAAAFIGRRLSAQLHDVLAAASVACTRLTVQATTESGREYSRTWRCAQPLTPDATADRIRWQLEGWLSGRSAADRPDGPVVMLRLDPVEVIGSGAMQLGLTGGGLAGGDGEVAERVRRALVRVQGLLGGERVQVPVRSGGRGPGQQITLVPLGDELVAQADPDAPWPGQLPGPSPSVLPMAPVTLLDAEDSPVQVTARGSFSADPASLTWGRRSWSLSWWAGPWATDERWWVAGPGDGGGGVDVHVGTYARAQVLLEDSRALLLHYQDGQWTVEGVYE
jgi:protein ImuB